MKNSKGVNNNDNYNLKRSKQQSCWGQPKYWDESRKPEEMCCPQINAGLKILSGVIMIKISINFVAISWKLKKNQTKIYLNFENIWYNYKDSLSNEIFSKTWDFQRLSLIVLIPE